MDLRKQGRTIFQQEQTNFYLCSRSQAVKKNCRRRKQDKATADCRERKNINLCGLLRLQRRKKQPTCESGGGSTRASKKQSSSERATCARGRKQKTTKQRINMSPQAGETNNQPARPVQRQETKQKQKQKTINPQQQQSTQQRQ